MRLNRTQEMARWIAAQQLAGALELFVEEPNRLHQQFRVSLRGLASNFVPRDAGMRTMLSFISAPPAQEA